MVLNREYTVVGPRQSRQYKYRYVKMVIYPGSAMHKSSYNWFAVQNEERWYLGAIRVGEIISGGNDHY